MNASTPPIGGIIEETLRGIVDRVTFHNPDTGWSVLRVLPFDNPHQQETVIVHQTRVFAGATMEFHGAWTHHPRHGRQFKAARAVEKKPATGAALEKYLGSGLIRGVGPKTARRIVRHFGDQTLEVFEGHMERLTEVPGIAHKKLAMIRDAWTEHRAIRDVMMFLQSHGISTLFAVRIYQVYGDEAIARVIADPYQLADDFYGIGFFSADKVALSIGLERHSQRRIMAAVKHVLAAGRQFGHCYLTEPQIREQVGELLSMDVGERIGDLLDRMEAEGRVMVRRLNAHSGAAERCFYAKSLYFDEQYVAMRIGAMVGRYPVDRPRVRQWIDRYCRSRKILLSEEQDSAVNGIVCEKVSILTGGPGVGKTTATLVLVRLLEAMQSRVMLAAPTGRAAQRMSEVIGKPAKTIHRLLEWQRTGFKKGEESPLDVDFLVVDECSMLDINLTAALFKAVPQHGRVLLIGDADQLPSVGAGNVLKDLISSHRVPCFRLGKIFRQAEHSAIIRFAHQINRGELPRIDSPFSRPEIWQNGKDCLFFDSDEATLEQLNFISRVKRFYNLKDKAAADPADYYAFRVDEPLIPYENELVVPDKFRHVDPEAVVRAGDHVHELIAIVKKVHPWSSLHYGLTAGDVIRKLYLEWIPRYYGNDCEIQVLTPMTRGSLGTLSLNAMIQSTANPAAVGKPQLMVGERIFRQGDRVIHRRNNYELGVFNGDIGVIEQIDNSVPTCVVAFFPDGRRVCYQRDDIMELDLAYAVTIHKSQGSEFEAVIIPVSTQHYKMLFRNLIYTGLTRARRLAVLVGTRKALAMAVRNQDTTMRQTALQELLATGNAL
jgi:exodeoxyribonuclease V alpha subunit